jgi:hypothetical protein
MKNVVKTKKINNQKIYPFWKKGIETYPVRDKHAIISNIPYMNIALPAKKGEGKSTTALNMIIDNFMTKNSKLVVFSPSLENDKDNKEALSYIRKKYNKKPKKKKKFFNEESSSSEEEDNSKYNDHVVTYKQFITDNKNDFLLEKHEAEEEYKLGNNGPYEYPKTIFYFDDLNKRDFKSDEIGTFAQNIRHHGSLAFYSSQDWINFEPRIRKNLDIVLLWGGVPKDRLKEIYNEIQPGIDYDVFLDFYYKATSKPKNFFFINVTNKDFRQNLNQELYIP